MKFEAILTCATLLTGGIILLNYCFRKFIKNLKENILIEYSRAFFPVLLLVLMLRSFVVEPFRIPSGSMKPTLLVGDFILVNKFNYGLRLPITGTVLLKLNKPKRGDILIFRYDERQDFIKRVVGLPGDHISYREKVLYVNDKPVELMDGKPTLDGNIPAFYQQELLGDKKHAIYTYPGDYRSYYPVNNIVVPENSYFVLGDNRDGSKDSRFWGFVPDEKIIGQAFATWFSWDWSEPWWQIWKMSIRWGRIGKKII